MLYNLAIFIYGILMRIGALFNEKAKKWVLGRKNLWSTLPNINNRKVIWFHCASLGEYDQGKPIMEAWKKEHPKDFLLVSFFSPSGYEHIAKQSIGDFTCYIPLDTKKNAKRFIAHFNPKKVFFIKYEIWNNHLTVAKENGAELFSISAAFRKNHRYFKWYGGTFRKSLFLFDHIFVQNEMSKKLLNQIGISEVTISGDTRFDRVMQRAAKSAENKIIAPWANQESIFIVGSSWPDDEEIIIPYINDFKIKSKVIIAPHEVDQKHITQIESQLKVNYQLYTKLLKGEELKQHTQVVILDCIGVLAEVYKYGEIAYVGGGFGTGLHNILEPAAFGLPVIFGPKHEKFPEAQIFIDNEIGRSCDENKSFYKAYLSFKKDKLENQVLTFMESQRGATSIVMKHFLASKG
ncbi:3-deoxy-D-manno-octulosonic acid transferase [Brumimicrobium salinarum]|uniref:3-deoxy-D-manno-octulosonic acid transferase n=1 Tax=Brumimicrobium salinarum TaxID=2058658 RepID=A0A2I0R3T1_9FLAO|nr:glycosyltransferase N-terminal domain-containing protein [Brumimicrobium salinarum]PKR81244.1 3-deoxy-D-manno-octulosonic acid transferase [Brumimicrobium salinarum]